MLMSFQLKFPPLSSIEYLQHCEVEIILFLQTVILFTDSGNTVDISFALFIVRMTREGRRKKTQAVPNPQSQHLGCVLDIPRVKALKKSLTHLNLCPIHSSSPRGCLAAWTMDLPRLLLGLGQSLSLPSLPKVAPRWLIPHDPAGEIWSWLRVNIQFPFY